MVFLTCSLFAAKKKYKHFIDKLRVFVKAGSGGQGLSKYGGIGGRGGNVYFVGSSETTLRHVMQKYPDKRFIAQNGQSSSSKCLQGAPGEDVIVKCPVGISLTTDGGVLLGEVNVEGDKVLAAKGGIGGSSKNSFIGQEGHQHSISLDFKLIADIGLVGFPNAGKSSLLKAVSRCSPKIASYPFTTIEPRVAVLEYPDLRQITMADLPGLIEGAHMNVGMGHRFLKHVERTKLILLIVDVYGFRLNPRYPLRSSFENVILLNKELELYKEELVHKPSLLVINKIDLPGADQKLSELMNQIENMKESVNSLPEEMRPDKLLNFYDVISISAKQKTNLDHLKLKLREFLDLHNDELNKEELDRCNEKQLLQIKLAHTEHLGLNKI